MSNPDQPHKVSNLASPIENAHSLEIDTARGILYLNGEFVCSDPDCSGTVGQTMKIFSLADPEHPALLAVYPTYVHHIHLRGTIGYASLIFEGVGGRRMRRARSQRSDESQGDHQDPDRPDLPAQRLDHGGWKVAHTWTMKCPRTR
jgi:hypothetical protein